MRFYLKIKNLSSKVQNFKYLGGYSQLFKYMSGPCRDCMLNVKITSDDCLYSEWFYRVGPSPMPLLRSTSGETEFFSSRASKWHKPEVSSFIQ